MGALDRLLRASVERAQLMQPKRVQRTVDEHLYSAPSAREEVEAISRAAARLVSAGLAPPRMGSVAVRRSPRHATVTAAGADLATIDNRQLERVPIDDAASPALAGVRAGDPAAVWAFPPWLMALIDAGLEIEPLSDDLAATAGTVVQVDSLDQVGSGLTMVRGRGVVSGHHGAEEAVARLEAAEALARMTIIAATIGRSHG